MLQNTQLNGFDLNDSSYIWFLQFRK